MMKRVIFILSFIPFVLFGQDLTIDKGSGIVYFTGVPGTTVDITCCSEFAVNVLTRDIYQWNRNTSAWDLMTVISASTGAPSGDPGSGPKIYVDNNTGTLYQWDGDSWEIILSRSNQVYTFTAAADTTTQPNAIEGDFGMIGDSILWIKTASQWIEFTGSGGSGGGSTAFDWNRPILRTWSVDDSIGGTDITAGLEWMFFTAPSLSNNLSPSTTVYEVGTSNAITISGSTTNPASATLSGGDLNRTVPGPTTSINSFGANTSYSQPITFTPQQGGSGDYNELNYSFQAEQDYTGVESGNVASTTRSIKGVYPVLYGMSATDLSATGDPYTVLTKLVEDEGNKTVTFTGTNEFMYFAFPASWSDNVLSQIVDHNGFEVTSSFTEYTVNVSSSGLTNDWSTVSYKLYKLNSLTSASGFDYQFRQ